MPSSLVKGFSRDDPKDGASAVPAGEARNLAPGRSRASSPPALTTGAQGALLKRQRMVRVTPASSCWREARPGLESRRSVAKTKTAVERREASGPSHGPLPRPLARLQEI